MASSTRSCRSTDRLRRFLLGVLLCLYAGWCAGVGADIGNGSGSGSATEGIHIRAAELVPGPGGHTLEAQYQIRLPHALEEALGHGVSLPFVVEFSLVYPRWWTLQLWNKSLAAREEHYRLSYNALTRQYQLGFGNLHQNFDALSDALAVMGHVHFPAVVGAEGLDRGLVYLSEIRLRLEVAQLPKPLQVHALATPEWNLSSDWYRWTFRP